MGENKIDSLDMLRTPPLRERFLIFKDSHVFFEENPISDEDDNSTFPC